MDDNKVSHLIHKLKKVYTTLVEENFSLIKDNQIRKIAALLNTGKRVILLGTEAENAVFEEFKLKYLKLGIDLNSVTRAELLEPSIAVLDADSIVIAFSLLGENENMKTAVKKAKLRGAYLMLITAGESDIYAELFDEIIRINYPAAFVNVISMQIVEFMLMDIIYAYCSANKNYFNAIKEKKKD